MSIEAMKQALEAFEVATTPLARDRQEVLRAQAALRQAIEQAEKQEPVAWMCSDESLLHKGYSRFLRNCEGAWNIPVYTTPPTAPVQEPYGWVSQHTVKGPYEWQFNKELSGVYRDNVISIMPVYTTPQPQREWVGLTEEEVNELEEDQTLETTHDFISAIEAKLKEKNGL